MLRLVALSITFLASAAVMGDVKPKGTILATECGSSGNWTFCVASSGKNQYVTVALNNATYYVRAKCVAPAGSIDRNEICTGKGAVKHPDNNSYVVETNLKLTLKSAGGNRVDGTLFLNGKEIGTSEMEGVVHTQ
jgi:hypothetical protein